LEITSLIALTPVFMHSNGVHAERGWIRRAKLRLAVLALVAGVALVIGVASHGGGEAGRTKLTLVEPGPAVTPSRPARPVAGTAHFADTAPLILSLVPATGRPGRVAR